MRIRKRTFLFWGAAATLAAGAALWPAKQRYCSVAPSGIRKRNLDYRSSATLTDEHKDLLRAIRPHYDTICFGDTNHLNSDNHFALFNLPIMQFVRSEEDGLNIRKFFIELPQRFNRLIDTLKNQEITPDEFVDVCKSKMATGWTSGYENVALCTRRAEIIASVEAMPDIITADAREGLSSVMNPVAGFIFNMARYAARPFETIMPTCRGRPFPTLLIGMAAAKTLGVINEDELSRGLMRFDRQVAQFIVDTSNTADASGRKEGIAILYGMGHFNGSARLEGHDTGDLKDHIRSMGRNPVVVAIFANDWQRRFYYMDMRRQDRMLAAQGKRVRRRDMDKPAAEIILGRNPRVVVNDPRVKEIHEAYLRSRVGTGAPKVELPQLRK